MDRDREIVRLVETYSDAVLRLSLSFLGNTADAADICQTVFLRLITRCPEFKTPEQEKAWVLTTAANACRDLLRSPWRRRRSSLEDCGELTAPPPPEGEVTALVQLLPAKYRTVIELYYYEGYDAAEIASILGTKPGTVYTRLKRGREQLRQILEGIPDEESTGV